MQVNFLSKAQEDFEFWLKTGNKPILKRINILTKAIVENPFSGIGKPEPLKNNLSGKWSRRITDEHRYIYEIENEMLFVYSLRGHYY